MFIGGGHDFGSNACCPKTGYDGYGPTFSHEVIKTSRFLSVVSLCPYARIPGGKNGPTKHRAEARHGLCLIWGGFRFDGDSGCTFQAAQARLTLVACDGRSKW